MTKRLRLDYSLLLREVRAPFLMGRNTGEIYSVLTQDINQIAGTSLSLIESIQGMILLAFCILYMFWLSPLGGAAAMLATVVGGLVYLLQDRVASERIGEARRMEARFFDDVSDLLRGFKEIRLNARRSDDLGSHLARNVAETERLNVEAERLFSLSFVTTQAIVFSLLAFIAILMPQIAGADPQLVFSFLTVILFAFGPVDAMLSSYPSFARARTALQRLRALEDAVRRVGFDGRVGADGSRFRDFRTITLRGVTARLGDEQAPEREAFRLGPVDLSINRGEILFISGSNGSGKTTLMSILCGLRPPDTGAIYVDGVEIDASAEGDYRNLFAAVFSDYHLFDQLHGLTDHDPSLRDALFTKLALSGRLSVSDNRFSSLRLSAGQKRRLALSVALLEARPILVLDEFAADQDPHHRGFFYEELLPSLKAEGRTVIAITHDEGRFHLCDRILKMEGGHVTAVVPGGTKSAVVPIQRSAYPSKL